MGSPTFGIPTSNNNAPYPIPGNTNPTGTNKGVGYGGSAPTMPMFGAPSTGAPISPSSNSGIFSGASGSGLANLFSNPSADYYNNPQFWNEVGKAYGVGTGKELQSLFQQMFNPDVVASFLNAQQPGINQGLASIQDSFGSEGSRFGSAAALGLGNYESQVNLNEQQTIAGMYQNAMGEELNLVSSMMPTLHQERADSGFMHDFTDLSTIMAGLTNMGTPFSVSQPPSMPGSTPQSPASSPGAGPNVASTGAGAGSTVGSDFGTMNAPLGGYMMDTSAGAALGGSDALASAGTAGGGLEGLMALFA